MTRNPIPSFAADYPARATELNHLNLSFYCINCQRKAETRYLTDNFGPFCDECLKELDGVISEVAGAASLLEGHAFNSREWVAMRRCEHVVEMLKGGS